MLLIIDNYDSFVFNVMRYCAEVGYGAKVVRNDAISIEQIERLAPPAIIISPGPASPFEAGLSLDIVRRYSGRIPIFGVCLGHQCIGAAFGGEIYHAKQPMHGRASAIEHTGDGLLTDLPNPLTVGRYHSLAVRETPQLTREVRVTARAKNGEIMGMAHRSHPTFGVQFHPESVLSENGHKVFTNFFEIMKKWSSNALA